MQVNLVTFLQTILQGQGLSFRIFSSPFSNIQTIDFGLRDQLFVNFDYCTYFLPLFEQCEEGRVCQFTDDFDTYLSLFRVPVPDQGEADPISYVVIGPYITERIGNVRFFEITQRLKIPQVLHRELLEYYNSLAILTPSAMENFLNAAATMIYEGSKNFKFVSLDNHMRLVPEQIEFNPSSTSEFAMSIIEQRYQMEDKLLYAIQCGDTNKALDLYTKFLNFKIVPRTQDPLRNSKNLMFVLNTLFRKTVQKSYVHPYHIDELSTHLAIKIEAMSNPEHSQTLGREMIRKYCNLVQNYSLRNYSPLIQKVVNYVDFHSSENLSLKVLAELFSVSPSYLSGLFKKEIKITLTDYINQKRIEHSLVLLNTTSLPIQNIAEQVGFSDVNYFTRTFKKFKGMSPREYRMEIQR
ncbi:MAG: helix-turn-helix domain-containing protein [bacterium]|nr:helix-turn-helix domain-containing protein [bacterium]